MSVIFTRGGIYLPYPLNANDLIRAHEDYYSLDSIPQFWDWLIEVGFRYQTRRCPWSLYRHEG